MVWEWLYGEDGYYTLQRDFPGKDFITAPELTPIFGKVLSNFIKEKSKELSLPLNLLELGGGRGLLSNDLVSLLSPKSYFVLEKGRRPPWVREEVLWRSSLSEVPQFEGFVVANEFFDAFPFKRVLRKGEELYEVFVVEENGKLREELRPFNRELPCKVKEGGEYPLFVGWEEFLRELSLKVKRGLLIAFDYGGSCSEVSSKRSFRAYKDGRLVDDYLNYPKRCDLTADVDFTYLSKILEDCGFKVLSLEPQSSFLLNWGIEKFATPDEVPQLLTLLVDMGRRFKVLVALKPQLEG